MSPRQAFNLACLLQLDRVKAIVRPQTVQRPARVVTGRLAQMRFERVKGERLAAVNRARGERVCTARLTEDIVKTMRIELARGATMKQMAARYGVSLATVSDVRRRKSWAHV